MSLSDLQITAVTAGIPAALFWDTDLCDIRAQISGYSKRQEDVLQIEAWHVAHIMTTISRALGGKRTIKPSDLLGKAQRRGVGERITKKDLSQLAEKVMYGGISDA